MDVEQQLREALSDLDSDIVEAERRLEELRQRRVGAESFIEYFMTRTTPTGTEPVADASSPVTRPAPMPQPERQITEDDVHVRIVGSLSPTAVVEKIIRDHNLYEFHTRDVAAVAEHEAPSLTKNQISNGLTYLRRLHFIYPGPKKGTWTRAEPGTVLSGSNDSGPAKLAGPEEASDDEFPSQGAVVVGAFGASQPAR